MEIIHKFGHLFITPALPEKCSYHAIYSYTFCLCYIVMVLTVSHKKGPLCKAYT